MPHTPAAVVLSRLSVLDDNMWFASAPLVLESFGLQLLLERLQWVVTWLTHTTYVTEVKSLPVLRHRVSGVSSSLLTRAHGLAWHVWDFFPS